MKVDGACYCGYLTFSAEIDPNEVMLCNCTDCQRFSGTAFRVVVPVDEGNFRLRSGEPTIFVKTAESGNRRKLAFCSRCGTNIYSAPGDENSTNFSLRAGTLRQFRELVPKHQIWRRSALPWLGDIVAIPSDDKE
jgi:hypothetical protein